MEIKPEIVVDLSETKVKEGFLIGEPSVIFPKTGGDEVAVQFSMNFSLGNMENHTQFPKELRIRPDFYHQMKPEHKAFPEKNYVAFPNLGPMFCWRRTS